MNIQADFSIKIDFDKCAHSPQRIFKTMSDLIEACQKIDKTLVQSISSKVEPLLLLEDVETGSLIGKFRQILESIDDEGLKKLEWKELIGNYLVKAKYLMIDFCTKRASITDGNEIKNLEEELSNLADQSGVKSIQGYTPPPRRDLIKDLGRFSKATSQLSENDKVIFIANDNRSVTFNLEFSISEESVEELITATELKSEVKMILKVKRPDYLGESKWEFRHGRTPINAKITDKNWLLAFQNRELDIRPGDSIECNVEVITRYDFNNEVLGVHHSISSVDSIIPLGETIQSRLELNPDS